MSLMAGLQHHFKNLFATDVKVMSAFHEQGIRVMLAGLILWLVWRKKGKKFTHNANVDLKGRDDR